MTGEISELLVKDCFNESLVRKDDTFWILVRRNKTSKKISINKTSMKIRKSKTNRKIRRNRMIFRITAMRVND